MPPARSNRTTADPLIASEPSTAWLFFVGLLLAARYLQPTEAVVFGDTLWQAQLWLVGAAVWCWFAFRARLRSLSFSQMDLFLFLIVLGHALSTILVFVEGGDRRAAVNVAWEWAGLSATLFLVRQLLPHLGRGRLVAGFTSVMVGLAALGMWQHHVSFRETADRYDELTTTETTLARRAAFGEASSAERRQLVDVRRQLSEFGIPQDESARRQWENRVKFSSEPFGTFGLANTLGGLLAAAIPLLLMGVRSQSGWRRVGLAVATAATFYCLLLTKSRTAWVGLVAGGTLAVVLYVARGRLDRRVLTAIAAMVVLITLAGVAVLASGGLDREVLSEAPKSLQYRLDYWTGTLAVLRERPILGTGPGNFRSYYLEHRPIGASEEIAAPHNLLLDIWTAGGAISLVALIALIGQMGFNWVRADSRDDTAQSDSSSGTPAFSAGIAAAYGVTFLVFIASGDGLDWRLAAMAPIALAALACQRSLPSRPLADFAVGAACLALLVHLLGADGIEFPAVTQTLLLLAVVLDRPRWTLGSTRHLLAGTVVFLLMAAGCLLTGLVPVLNSSALTARATAAVAAGDPSAERMLLLAIEADPLAMTPRRLQAELATARAASSGQQSDLIAARREWNDLLARDPRSIAARQGLAGLLLETGAADDARSAAELLDQAVGLSPTDSQLRVATARAFIESGQPTEAAQQARAALRLDDVNRKAGHTDILLDASTRSEMQAAVGNPAAVP